METIEDLVRKIVREEIGVWIQEANKHIDFSTTTTSAPCAVTYSRVGTLTCPWSKTKCAYVGRQGTRAGGGLFCTRQMNGELNCPEGVKFNEKGEVVQ